tara:strand:+ start:684 stop:1187 length:504 start_codon:yes stop_codon:yes gene_type:complete
MAIRDISKKPFINDRNERVSIGIDLPFRKSVGKDGWFATTATTVEAVKNNIKNLLNTHQGERLFQPSIGLNLRKYLFEQITEDLIISITEEIRKTMNTWLPFVQIKSLRITRNKNLLNVVLIFNITKNERSLEQMVVNLGQVGTDGEFTGTISSTGEVVENQEDEQI